MLLEHLIYNIAIAIFIYTIFNKRYILGIIILSSYSPDIDLIADKILKKIGIELLIHGKSISHGDFHNILILLIYAILVALILNMINIKMRYSFILASIGFMMHLFEDALVFKIGYRFFWSFSNKIYGIGLIADYNDRIDLYGIANKDVLTIGIICIFLSLVIYYIKRKYMTNIGIIKKGDEDYI